MLGKLKMENLNTKETGLGDCPAPPYTCNLGCHSQYLLKKEMRNQQHILLGPWNSGGFQPPERLLCLDCSWKYVFLWDGLLLCVWALSHQDVTGRQHSCVLSQPAARNMKCILIKQASWKLVPAFLQTSSRTHSLSWFCPWFFCCSESKSYACNSLLRLKSH